MKRILLVALVLLILTGCGVPTASISTNQVDEPTINGGNLFWQEQYDLGLRYLTEGNYEEAILSFAAAIEIDPRQALAYVGRGDAYVLSGETEANLTSALADYGTAIELDETNADAYLGLVDVYIRLGDYENALVWLELATEKLPDNEEISRKLQEVKSGTVHDSEGRIRRESNYDGNGNLTSFYVYSYENGRSITSYRGDGTLIGTITDVYDDSGRMIEGCYSWDHNGNMQRGVYEYDEDGSRETVSVYDIIGNLTSIVRREYSDDGKSFTEYEYTPNSELQTYTYHERDEKGHTVMYSNFDAEGNMNYRYVREYDGDQLVRDIRYNGDGSLAGYITYEYDNNGIRVASRHYDADGNLTHETITDRK